MATDGLPSVNAGEQRARTGIALDLIRLDTSVLAWSIDTSLSIPHHEDADVVLLGYMLDGLQELV